MCFVVRYLEHAEELERFMSHTFRSRVDDSGNDTVNDIFSTTY